MNILKSLLLGFAYPWKLNRFWNHYEKVYHITPCENIIESIYDQGINVMNHINSYDMFILQYKNTSYRESEENQERITYCQGGERESFTSFSENSMDVRIGIDLIYHPNVLFNVILHEFVHMMGLIHSDHPGIMNYSIILDRFMYIKEDNNRLWISPDDYTGIRNNYVDSKVIWCNTKPTDEEYNICVDTPWSVQLGLRLATNIMEEEEFMGESHDGYDKIRYRKSDTQETLTVDYSETLIIRNLGSVLIQNEGAMLIKNDGTILLEPYEDDDDDDDDDSYSSDGDDGGGVEGDDGGVDTTSSYHLLNPYIYNEGDVSSSGSGNS